MIIHGGYAKMLRERQSGSPNDIDLFTTQSGLEELFSSLSGEHYVIHRGSTGTANREVILLVPRDRKLRSIKFDIEVVPEDLYKAVWELEDTTRQTFLGLQVGVVSAATDMIIKEECLPFTRSKHRIDVEAYKQELGDKDLTPYATFRKLWAKQMSDKYLTG